ncbi:potassium channel family protein [Malaciobacter marinus]|uniref:potassium channel family protein n=1 Tax=Malaciobacter marinus TaxID=505249 RepID=UPI003AFF6174
MKISPFIVLLIYFLVIIIYAILYLNIPNILNIENIKELTFLNSVYFSIVTITTLGYGEITPKSELGMILVSSESILGIIIIGLFLNSLWQRFSERIEKTQEKSIKLRISEQNLHGIISYYKYLNTIITNYKIYFAELTTPINKRQDSPSPNPNFIFSDLQDLYKQSLLTRSGFSKPVIHLYFEQQDEK